MTPTKQRKERCKHKMLEFYDDCIVSGGMAVTKKRGIWCRTCLKKLPYNNKRVKKWLSGKTGEKHMIELEMLKFLRKELYAK